MRTISMFVIAALLFSCRDYDSDPIGVGFSFYTVDSSCAGRVFVFNNYGKGALDYHWDFGDGETSDEESPAKVFKKAGAYIVTLTNSRMEKSISMSKKVYVDRDSDLPGPETAFERKSGSTTKSFDVTFSNRTPGGNSFLWEFGDGTSTTLTTPDDVTHTFPSKGVYTVTLTSTNAAGTTCATKAIELAWPD